MSRVEQELAAREDLAEKLRRMSQYYSEQPPKVRKREFVYLGIFLAILAYHITDAAPQGQDGQASRIVPANLAATNARSGSPTTPAVAAPQAAVYANIIAECLNGSAQIRVGGEPVAECKKVKK